MKKILTVSSFICSVVALVGVIYLFVSSNAVKRVAFVRSEDLIYGYAGMKEVEGAFQAKEAVRKSTLDTLSSDFQREYANALEGAHKMSAVEKKEVQASLQGKQAQFVGYTQAIQEESKKEEAEMLSGVLTQINAFVKTYAEAQGFDLVLGTTSDGNILYGSTGLDITDALLKALNEDYHGN